MILYHFLMELCFPRFYIFDTMINGNKIFITILFYFQHYSLNLSYIFLRHSHARGICFKLRKLFTNITAINQEVPVPVRLSACQSACPRFWVLRQNCFHQTSASAYLLLAMLWSDLFVSSSCSGLESPINFIRYCYCDGRQLYQHPT